MDVFNSELDVDPIQLNSEAPPVPEDCDHKDCQGRCWKEYPQSRFPNWTSRQVKKCGIHDAIVNYDRSKRCKLYKLDVERSSLFCDAGTIVLSDGDVWLDGEWDRFKDDNVRVFIFSDSLKVLTMFFSKRPM